MPVAIELHARFTGIPVPFRCALLIQDVRMHVVNRLYRRH
jgi:hypothetical protein